MAGEAGALRRVIIVDDNELTSAGFAAGLREVVLHPERFRRGVPGVRDPDNARALGVTDGTRVEELVRYVEETGLAGSLDPSAPTRDNPGAGAGCDTGARSPTPRRSNRSTSPPASRRWARTSRRCANWERSTAGRHKVRPAGLDPEPDD